MYIYIFSFFHKEGQQMAVTFHQPNPSTARQSQALDALVGRKQGENNIVHRRKV